MIYISGVGKIIGIRFCAQCGKEVEIRHKKRMEHENVYCSKKCELEHKKSKNLNCECEVCHTKFHRKQSWIDKNKHQYCSHECQAIANRELMKGCGNHQYGLKGSRNASWKSDERISNYGYRLIRSPEHPFRNSDNMVFEHRLVAEKELLNEENSIIINGQRYLSPDYHVHHMDFDKLNNDSANLYPLPKALHMSFHNRINKTIFDSESGRIKKIINAKDMYSKEELIEKFYEFIKERGDGGFGSTGTN